MLDPDELMRWGRRGRRKRGRGARGGGDRGFGRVCDGMEPIGV